MKNKELLLRRMESLEGLMKRMRNSLNELDIERTREILTQMLELREEIQSIVERED
jgi:hypothetical protein